MRRSLPQGSGLRLKVLVVAAVFGAILVAGCSTAYGLFHNTFSLSHGTASGYSSPAYALATTAKLPNSESHPPVSLDAWGYQTNQAGLALKLAPANSGGGCNTICHTPMDPYAESYQNGKSVNPVQTGPGTLLGVTVHRDSSQDIRCGSCHQDAIDIQFRRCLAWAFNNYELPLEMTLTTRSREGNNYRYGVAFCLVEGCHEGISSLDDLKNSTAGMKRDPHTNHNGDQACSNCHQMHEQSYMMCSQCHADADIPEGWLTYKEQQAQKKAASEK